MSQSELVSLLLALAPYLVPVLVSVLTVLVKQAFAKLPANQRPVIQDIVSTAVTATKQVAGAELNGPGKKQLAVDKVETELAHWGIKVPSSVVSDLIEQAVDALAQPTPAQTPIKKGA